MAAADELLERAKNGDGQALDALLEQHLPMVYRFVSRKRGSAAAYLDDVVQETLIAAARSIGSVRGEHDGAVPAWFLTIARHKVADHFRRAPARTEALDLAAVSDGSDVQAMVSERDRNRRLREAMGTLTPDQEE